MPSTGRLVLPLAVALLCACGSPSPSKTTSGTATEASDRIAAARLGRLLELAEGKEFYLVYEPGSSHVRLMYQGVTLQEFAVEQASVGVRRLLYIEHGAPKRWEDRIWDDGKLDPERKVERREIIPPDPADSEPEEVVIPPTPEEAIPSPDRFLVRFAGGLVVEIVGDFDDRADDGLLGWSFDRLSALVDEASSVLFRAETDEMRLRLVIDGQAAHRLYRSLPEPCRFAVHLSAPAG